MTKKEIMEAWEDVPDDYEVLIDTWDSPEPINHITIKDSKILFDSF